MTMSFNGANGISFSDGSTQNTGASGFGFKNRIINGDMRIDQRNSGSSITPTAGQYSTDRWQTALNVSSKISLQRVADAPAGFTYSLKATSLSAYAIGSGELVSIRQYIEGYNFADLDWGLSTAKPAALSFWVKSSLTGNFGGIVGNDSDRTYPFLYTINAANTWEYKTVYISSGPTSGYRDITNSVGASVIFSFGAGSSFLGTSGQWNNANQYGATGQTSLVATNGATMQITGVQLEKGSTVTDFDYRPHGYELQLCHRYYKQYIGASSPAFTRIAIGENVGTSRCDPVIVYGVPMRSAPTLSVSANSHFGIYNQGNNLSCSNLYVDIASDTSMNFIAVPATGSFNVGGAGQLFNNTTSARLGLSAEL